MSRGLRFLFDRNIAHFAVRNFPHTVLGLQTLTYLPSAYPLPIQQDILGNGYKTMLSSQILIGLSLVFVYVPASHEFHSRHIYIIHADDTYLPLFSSPVPPLRLQHVLRARPRCPFSLRTNRPALSFAQDQFFRRPFWVRGQSGVDWLNYRRGTPSEDMGPVINIGPPMMNVSYTEQPSLAETSRFSL